MAAEQLMQDGGATQVPMPAAFQLVQAWPLGQGGYTFCWMPGMAQ
jgi:hypothetical protein